MSHLLSKSKYIRGLQCDRALWLDMHMPQLAHYTAEQQMSFDYGRTFEREFKDKFPEATDISSLLGPRRDRYASLTAEVLDRKGGVTLFEAGFEYDGVLVLADVVKKNSDGSLDVFEVKSGTALTDTYRHDASVQRYIIGHCRDVHRFCIVHRSAEQNAESQFVVVDLTDYTRQQMTPVEANISKMKTIAAGSEPLVATGLHCTIPYGCPYTRHCTHTAVQLPLF